MVKKALILAAGLGTRLRPFTNTTPKPLLLIKNKPLLQYHLEQLKKHGISDVLINTHYLSEQIEEFINKYRNTSDALNVKIVFEPELLGSAGTLHRNRDFFANEKHFIVTYGDNLTDINYTKLIKEHANNSGIGTIAVYDEEKPEQKGIIEIGQSGKIIKFLEKPKSGTTYSHLANAGVYVLSSDIFDIIDKEIEKPLDFGFHIFPKILNTNHSLYIYKMNETVLDIGNPENYTKAQTLIENMKL